MPGDSLQEIIVTATKRPEEVRAISGSVTAMTGRDLEQLGAQSMADYLTRTPGVVFNASIPGDSSVAIRGVSTTTGLDQGQGTTGYFINDVPLTDPYNSVATPDIDTFDVDNVAVLRGPQGTLFGSASLGGAINYQAAQPDLKKYDLHLQGTAESTKHGGTGGSGKMMVNVPLIENVFAVRAVYIYRQDAGYIDNLGTGQKDANRTLVRGGRIEALWTPSDNTRVSYLYLDQTQDTRDLGYDTPGLTPPLEKDSARESYDFRVLLHNLRVDQDLGIGTLTVTASYHEKTQYSVQDYTLAAGGLLPGVSPILIIQPATSDGTTFEARLASPAGDRFEYLVGLMHDAAHEHFVNLLEGPGAAAAIEAAYGPIFGAGIGELSAPNDVVLNATIPVTGLESALFGEATYHFNDAWKATLGGRAFETQDRAETSSYGFLTLVSSGALSSDLTGSQKQSGFLPKGSITWTPNQDMMAYALVDKGFRYGGPNLFTAAPGASVPAQFRSDSLINYEIGTRTSWLDQRLQLDASIFHIDWSDVQLHLQTSLGLNYAANAGKAKINGFEGTAKYRVTQGLTLSGSLTNVDAKLAEPFDSGSGQGVVPKGATLPGASKWQATGALNYEWSSVPLTPSLVVADRYISKAPGIFYTGLPQGDYNLVDVRLALHAKQLTFTAFVDNLADRRGLTNANVLPPVQDFYVRPRTVGLTVDYRL
jgi:outer membrane receptor protein involved in Fe transport